MQKNGSEILAECLLEQGVDTVFGYPGGAVLNIYDALYQYRNKIRHILTAHEQGAAHAADGYARASGKVGVVIATSGPGATNLITGLATAHMDSVPVVAITGNVATSLLGKDSFQEVDITAIAAPITKKCFLVKDVSQLADTVRTAFRLAMSGRRGPVLIDIPKDVTSAVTEYTAKKPLPPLRGGKPTASVLEKLCAWLTASERPLIYAGGGVLSSGASSALLALSEKADIPVASSLMGLGGFPGSHGNYAGLIGMHGTYAANRAAAECDLLLVCGSRFSDRVAGDCEHFAPRARIVHIDIDPKEFGKNVLTDLRVSADLSETLTALVRETPFLRHPEWQKALEQWRSVTVPAAECEECLRPAALIREVQRLTEADTLVATDVGQHQMWVAQSWCFTQPCTLLTSGGLGTMGYGLGAAIGAKVARPASRVILFTGDGSFHMNLNELATLVSYRLPITVFLLNNSVLGMVRQWQKIFYGSRFSETDPHRQTDFIKLAEAFGAKGLILNDPAEMSAVVREALSADGPVLVDCRISPDENVLPMIPPGANVENIQMEME